MLDTDKILKDITDQYNKHHVSLGDYSVTHFIDPPRIVHLIKRYGHLVQRPVNSVIPALVGQGTHKMVENLVRSAGVIDPVYQAERTVVEKLQNRIITGRTDVLFDMQHIIDIKTCKTWALIFDPEMTEWAEQQNIYAWLFGLRGFPIESIWILAIYLDWIESKSLRDKKYPKSPYAFYQLPLWPKEQAESFVHDKLSVLIDCESIPDNELPICSAKERWENHSDGAVTHYAVMKNEGANRAMRVLKTEKEAREYCSINKSKLTSTSYIEARYARRKRCDKYCVVNTFCDEYQRYNRTVLDNKLVDRIKL